MCGISHNISIRLPDKTRNLFSLHNRSVRRPAKTRDLSDDLETNSLPVAIAEFKDEHTVGDVTPNNTPVSQNNFVISKRPRKRPPSRYGRIEPCTRLNT